MCFPIQSTPTLILCSHRGIPHTINYDISTYMDIYIVSYFNITYKNAIEIRLVNSVPPVSRKHVDTRPSLERAATAPYKRRLLLKRGAIFRFFDDDFDRTSVGKILRTQRTTATYVGQLHCTSFVTSD